MNILVGRSMAAKTIVDIARAAGVSFKTVSRVINREPSVRQETREHVEKVIARLNYQPNVWARALRSSRSHLVALICRNANVGYINRVESAARNFCQRAGYHLFVMELGLSARHLGKRIEDMLKSIELDGVLLVPPLADNIEVLDFLKAKRIPYVRLAPYDHLDRGFYVKVDDRAAAHEITSYLLSLGHRDIAFIGGPDSHAAAARRREGFLAAMQEHGVAVRPEWMLPGDFTARGGASAGEALLALKHRPTAVFAGTDEAAMGVMFAAHRHHLDLPRDLSIVGFDDAPIATSLWPQLTTVRQPLAKMADIAADMLLDQIAGESKKKTTRDVELKVVVRGSAVAPGGDGKEQRAGRKRGARR
jgi:LacI family transcriptional regulator